MFSQKCRTNICTDGCRMQQAGFYQTLLDEPKSKRTKDEPKVRDFRSSSQNCLGSAVLLEIKCEGFHLSFPVSPEWKATVWGRKLQSNIFQFGTLLVLYPIFLVQRLNTPRFILMVTCILYMNLHSSLCSGGNILVVTRPAGITNS